MQLYRTIKGVKETAKVRRRILKLSKVKATDQTLFMPVAYNTHTRRNQHLLAQIPHVHKASNAQEKAKKGMNIKAITQRKDSSPDPNYA